MRRCASTAPRFRHTSPPCETEGVSLTIATVNVNGIRAAARKGMWDWFEDAEPDIVTLQEVRAPAELVTALLDEHLAGWYVAHEIATSKGRSGVAIASRPPLLSMTSRLGGSGYEDSGRWIEATVDTTDGRGLTVISAYVHTGDTTNADRMEEKLAFLSDAVDRVCELREQGGHVVLTGDLNVAHHEVDIKNWRGNVGKAGFHPTERAHLDRLIGDLGWTDLGRHFGGDGPGPYTWWSYRGRSFDNDAGWRIDYQIASPDLAALAKDARVDRAPSHGERWSDHAPLVVTFDL